MGLSVILAKHAFCRALVHTPRQAADQRAISSVFFGIKNMKSLVWLMVLGLSLACVSCAKKKHPDPALWQIQSPQAKVISCHVTQQTDAGFRVEAVIELSNDNRVPLPLLDTHYTIKIEKVGSISLVDEAKRTVPAFGKQQLILAASFAWKDPAPAGAVWTVTGRVKYDPPGELRQILTETKIPLPDSHFHDSGKLR